MPNTERTPQSTGVPKYITTATVLVRKVVGESYGPPEECRIQIEIDVDYLLRELGTKAVRSKSGRSKLQDGRVTVRHLR